MQQLEKTRARIKLAGERRPAIAWPAIAGALAIIASFLMWAAPQGARAFGDEALLTVAVLKVPGAVFNREQAIAPWIYEIERRTSIKANPKPVFVEAGDKTIFNYPFILMTGADEFPPFNDKELQNLRRYLKYGGLLFADNTQAIKDYGFDKSFRRMLGRLFPDLEIKATTGDHSLFRSFYLLDYVPGRVIVDSFFEGIEIDGRWPVVYSKNDITGAWARDSYGSYLYSVSPGGERQREMAFRQGVNLVLYALTIDYKKDAVHIPHILKRRK